MRFSPEELSCEIRKARKLTLDYLEEYFGHHPEWDEARRRILRVFGNEGLQRFATDSETEHPTGCDKGAIQRGESI